MSSTWHRHQHMAPVSAALTAIVGWRGAPWARGHVAQHLRGTKQRGEGHAALQGFASFSRAVTEDSCNRFSLATSTSLLRLPQVKEDRIQSGELKQPFTVPGRCSSTFFAAAEGIRAVVPACWVCHMQSSCYIYLVDYTTFFQFFHFFLPDGNK